MRLAAADAIEPVLQTIERNDTEKREYMLLKRDGREIPARIPAHYTVREATSVLAEKAGYEPQVGKESLSFRMAVETETGGHRLLSEETRFSDLEEGLRMRPIPSLAPARIV